MRKTALVHECVRFLDDFLSANQFKDFCPNGLQVEGQHEVSKIVSGVSASMELFQKAYQYKAQMILVHHGILWNTKLPVITGNLKNRLQYLIQKDISLVAYHLPLDAHLQIGNNIQIAHQLELSYEHSFAFYGNQPIGVVSKPPSQWISFEELKDKINQVYDNVFILDVGPSKISKIAIVSGAGASYLDEAIACGCDALISGEVKESSVYLAQEAGIHLIGLGHYQSEKLGIQALAQYLASNFQLQHQFIDIPNPL